MMYNNLFNLIYKAYIYFFYSKIITFKGFPSSKKNIKKMISYKSYDDQIFPTDISNYFEST